MNNGILVNFRDTSLFWQSVSGVFSLSILFFSLSILFFSYEKPLFIGNSMVFNLEFSLSIY